MEGKIAGLEKEPIGQRTRFERIQLPEGQLSVVHPLPPDFPPDFAEQLISEQPWRKKGKPLHEGGRKPELHHIAGMPIVKKKLRWSGRAAKEWIRDVKSMVRASTPSAQMAVLDEAKRRYKEAYREDLLVEEPIAFYIDRETTQKFMFYRYLKRAEPARSREDSEKRPPIRRYFDIVHKLEAVGVYRGDAKPNYIIVEDPSSEDGIRVVLIDTEFLKLAKR